MNPHLNDLIKQVLDSKRPIKEQKMLLNELRKMLAPEQNRWNFRYAIWTLALIALSIPLVVLLMQIQGKSTEIPAGLLSLGSAAVGALAAFLSPFTRKSESESSRQDSTKLPDSAEEIEARVFTSEKLQEKSPDAR